MEPRPFDDIIIHYFPQKVKTLEILDVFPLLLVCFLGQIRIYITKGHKHGRQHQ